VGSHPIHVTKFCRSLKPNTPTIRTRLLHSQLTAVIFGGLRLRNATAAELNDADPDLLTSEAEHVASITWRASGSLGWGYSYTSENPNISHAGWLPCRIRLTTGGQRSEHNNDQQPVSYQVTRSIGYSLLPVIGSFNHGQLYRCRDERIVVGVFHEILHCRFGSENWDDMPFEDSFNRFDRIGECDGEMDRRTDRILPQTNIARQYYDKHCDSKYKLCVDVHIIHEPVF